MGMGSGPQRMMHEPHPHPNPPLEGEGFKASMHRLGLVQEHLGFHPRV